MLTYGAFLKPLPRSSDADRSVLSAAVAFAMENPGHPACREIVAVLVRGDGDAEKAEIARLLAAAEAPRRERMH